MAIVALALCCVSLPGAAQKTYVQKAHLPKAKPVAVEEKSTVEPGVVVEEVQAGREGDKAGLKIGDVILGWSRNDVSGRIESPFDYIWVDIEQRPRGEVTLHGMREHTKMSWILRRGDWAIKTRPNLSGRLLDVFSKSWAMASRGQGSEGAHLWSREKGLTVHNVSWFDAWSMFNEALLYRSANNEAQADRAYQAAAELADSNKLTKSRILNSWGGLSCHNGNFGQAEERFKRSISLADQEGQDSLLKAYSLNDLAKALVFEARSEDAESIYARALEVREQLAPESLELADTLEGIGNLLVNEDKLAQASAVFSQALVIEHRNSPESVGEAFALANLGWIASSLGELDQAEKYDLLAFKIYRKVGPDNNLAVVLNGLGDVAMRRGDLAGASVFLRQAIKAIQQQPDSNLDLATDLAMLALIEFDQGAFTESRILLKRAGSLLAASEERNPNYVLALNNLGEAARHIRQSRAAKQYLTKSIEIAQKYDEKGYAKCWALLQLAEVHLDRGDFLAAEPLFQQALTMSRTVFPASADQAEIYAGLARIARNKGSPLDAADYYSNALTALEAQATHLGGAPRFQAAYRANHLDYYRDYIDLLVQQHWNKKAFDALERSRARTLLETLSAATVDIHQGADPDLLKSEHTLQAEIKAKSAHRVHMLTQQHTPEQMKALESEIADLTRQYDEVEENLRSTSPNYAALTQPQPLTTEEIQKQLLDKDTVLVEYSLGEKRSYAFVVTPDSLTAHELPSQLKIEQEARRLHRLLKSPGVTASEGTSQSKVNATYQTVGASHASVNPHAIQAEVVQREMQRTAALLSRMVLDPIAGEIGNKRLLIVADGALHYIPFTALPEPSTPCRNADKRIATGPAADSQSRSDSPSFSVRAGRPAQAAGAEVRPNCGSSRAGRSGIRQSRRSSARSATCVAPQTPRAQWSLPQSRLPYRIKLPLRLLNTCQVNVRSRHSPSHTLM